MSITSLQSLMAAGYLQQSNGKSANKLQATVAALAAGSRLNRAGEDVASLSVATGLQSQVTSLKQSSVNVAQGAGVLEVADGGLDQIGTILDRMRALAVQGNSGALSESARAGINTEFKNLTQEINRLAETTRFNGQSLLNNPAGNTFSFRIGDDASEVIKLTVDSADSATLFAGRDPDLLSADASSAAVRVIDDASTAIAKSRANVGTYRQALDIVGAGLDSAIQNQEAARATLEDTDFGATSTANAQASLQQRMTLALMAQTNKMPANLMQLLVG